MDTLNIKELRKALGLSQEKFSRLIGVTLGTINRWEKGTSKPHPLAQEKLNALVETALNLFVEK